MLSGMDGSPSTIRTLTAIVVLFVIGTWTIVSIRTNQLQPLTIEQVSIVLGAMGIKAWQRGKETSQPEPTKS